MTTDPTTPDAPVEAQPEMALALVGDVSVDLPLFPGYQEMQGMAAMAVTLAAAAAVPAAMRGKPNDVFLVLLTGRELGIPPTTAIRECHVIDGKVTISPKVKLAMVRSKGLGKVWPDAANSATSATWHAERLDMPGMQFANTFTVEDAKRAGLVGKDNWTHYPQRMLSWRSLAGLLDDVFSEVGTGLYSPDEVGAMTNEDGEVIEVASAEPLPGTKAPPPKPGSRAAPAPPPADPGVVDDLRTRVESLPESGRLACVDAWREKLPVPAKLLSTQVVIAEALVAGFERRAKAGEWAPDTPEVAQELSGAPGEGDGDSGSAPAPEAAPGGRSAASRSESFDAAQAAAKVQSGDAAGPEVAAALHEEMERLTAPQRARAGARLHDAGINLTAGLTWDEAEQAEAILLAVQPEGAGGALS